MFGAKERAAHHMRKSAEHASKGMGMHERAGHDGQHTRTATGDMAAVKRTAGGKVTVGSAGESGGKQGSKGLSGANPNS